MRQRRPGWGWPVRSTRVPPGGGWLERVLPKVVGAELADAQGVLHSHWLWVVAGVSVCLRAAAWKGWGRQIGTVPPAACSRHAAREGHTQRQTRELQGRTLHPKSSVPWAATHRTRSQARSTRSCFCGSHSAFPPVPPPQPGDPKPASWAVAVVSTRFPDPVRGPRPQHRSLGRGGPASLVSAQVCNCLSFKFVFTFFLKKKSWF